MPHGQAQPHNRIEDLYMKDYADLRQGSQFGDSSILLPSSIDHFRFLMTPTPYQSVDPLIITSVDSLIPRFFPDL